MNDQRMTTAIHEAAHCVASIHVGHYVNWAKITSNGGGLMSEGTKEPHELQRAMNKLFICLAGPVAESIHLDTNPYDLPKSVDLACAFAAARFISQGDADDAERLLVAAVDQLLKFFHRRLPRARLAAIANRLARWGELDGETIANLYYEAKPGRLRANVTA